MSKHNSKKWKKFENFSSLSKLEQLQIAIGSCQPKTPFDCLLMDMEQLELEHSTVCKLVPIHHLVWRLSIFHLKNVCLMSEYFAPVCHTRIILSSVEVNLKLTRNVFSDMIDPFFVRHFEFLAIRWYCSRFTKADFWVSD